MTTGLETSEFQAEAHQLLRLTANSVDSSKDIVLRKLISGASEALDELRSAALGDMDPDADASDLHITIEADAAAAHAKRDNRRSMSRDEVAALIGAIAKSNTAELLRTLKRTQNTPAPPALIGFVKGVASAALLAVVVSFTTSCTASPSRPDVVAPIDTASTRADAPAPSSLMICADEAKEEISAVLGVQPSQPPAHTWSDHLYTCRYRFADGTIVLSVKELADPAAAATYYAARLAANPGRPLPGLGQDAFAAPDGYTVVRKDTSVLQVDVTGLPNRFGPRMLPHTDIGITVAAIIMGCWT